jgi:Holliday junction resolvasome RuvABC endonuclease subunit
MIKTILSIDPSTSCGFALYLYDQKKNALNLIYSCVVDGSLLKIGRFAAILIKITHPDEMYIEDYLFNKFTRNGANVNVEIRGILKWLYEDIMGREATVMGIGEWTKLATGNGRAKKKDVIVALQTLGVECNYSFVNHRLLKFRDDESDAIAIGYAGIIQKYGRPELHDYRPHRSK